MSHVPSLRRTRRKFGLTGLAAAILPSVAVIDRTVEPYARRWDEHNQRDIARRGPLWVALGDSTGQGVGASAFDRGYVGLVRDRLVEHSEQPWRVINLSMSGARFADVVDTQLSAFAALGLVPNLVTCVVGSNDVIWRWDRGGIVTDARRLVRALPGGTLLSRLGEGGRGRRRPAVNQEFQRRGDLDLFEIWSWPSGEGSLASDRFHPSDVGYRHMADLLWDALVVRGQGMVRGTTR